MLSLGTSLQMTTTAEGVETDEQMAFLRDEGCKQVQGYLFGRPMQPEEMTVFLASRKGRKSRGRSSTAA